MIEPFAMKQSTDVLLVRYALIRSGSTAVDVPVSAPISLITAYSMGESAAEEM